ncbi:MAG: SAM-dependent methyltransferase [Phycisphaeraceae bacterium]|nr:SAM-dependent methyltransferase [Phycisphaeraceae bacterium]
MAFKSNLKSELIASYINQTMIQESELQQQLREETAKLPNSNMQVSPDQGAFLSLLIKMTHARRAIEVGTFTGYSALCLATALPHDGQLICCDVSDEWTSIGKPYWKQADVDSKIDLRIAPAIETLDQLIEQGQAGQFDFAFIDADKPPYPDYYERCYTLLKHGGVIVLDNILMHIKDDAEDYDMDHFMHEFNMNVREDDRVDAMIVGVGGGMLLAWKK